MFLFICILMMWLMIFGVGVTYYANLSGSLSGKIIFQFVILILISSLAWLVSGVMVFPSELVFGRYFLPET
ncbi:hypothetical protein [Streptococcus bovimastitidis]